MENQSDSFLKLNKWFLNQYLTQVDAEIISITSATGFKKSKRKMRFNDQTKYPT